MSLMVKTSQLQVFTDAAVAVSVKACWALESLATLGQSILGLILALLHNPAPVLFPNFTALCVDIFSH